jgi:hypothetical protein
VVRVRIVISICMFGRFSTLAQYRSGGTACQ